MAWVGREWWWEAMGGMMGDINSPFTALCSVIKVHNLPSGHITLKRRYLQWSLDVTTFHF